MPRLPPPIALRSGFTPTPHHINKGEVTIRRNRFCKRDVLSALAGAAALLGNLGARAVCPRHATAAGFPLQNFGDSACKILKYRKKVPISHVASFLGSVVHGGNLSCWWSGKYCEIMRSLKSQVFLKLKGLFMLVSCGLFVLRRGSRNDATCTF